MKKKDILVAKLKAEIKISKVVAEHQKKFPPKEQNAGQTQTPASVTPDQPDGYSGDNGLTGQP